MSQPVDPFLASIPIGPPAPTQSVPAPPVQIAVPNNGQSWDAMLAGALGPAPKAAPPPPGAIPITMSQLNAAMNPPPAGPPAASPAPAGPPGPPPPADISGTYAGQLIGPPRPPTSNFPLHLVGGGGVIPAHEVEKRGPSLLRAQAEANLAQDTAIKDVAQRTMETAAAEQAMYLDQQRQAHARENAIQQAAAERQQELEQRQQDFDSSVKQLSSMSQDPDRFWASRNTGQKIAGMIGIALGGFLQGARGGSNPGLDIINQAIDRDIDAQKFAYNATKDTAIAKQTAYAQAMQKYMSPEAAQAAARASALDAVQGQLGQMAAQYKGTTAGSQAEMMLAELQRLKEQQIGQGIAFIQPQQVGRTFYDPRTHITYSEADARKYAERLENQQFELGKQELGQQGTIQNTIAGKLLEGAVAGNKDKRAQMVQLPNGDVVQAPSDVEAGKLRDLSAAASNINRLVDRAKTIRDNDTWRVDPSARAELENIQARLMTSFSAAANLGALSKDDLKIAQEATGDLFTLKPGIPAKLDAYARQANTAVSDRVRTIPEAPGTAKGQMPSSFTPHGK